MTALALLMLAFLGAVDRRGDRLVLALWLGLLSGGAALLAVALFVPLTPAVFAACLAAGAAFALSPRVRGEVGRIVRGTRRADWAAALLLLVVAAAVGSRPINNRDAISYQHDILQWLSDTGVVPGLNLVERRFGYVTSWFAYGAAANHGWMRARAGTLADSLALFLALLHLGTAAARLLGRRGRPADGFAAVAGPLALAMPVALKVPASTSPDLPAVILSVVCAWSFLVVPRRTGARGGLLPVLLAAGAVSVKLSAAPLLAVAGLHWLVRRPRPADWAAAAAGVAGLLGPWVAAMTVTTGCPLYPVPVAIDVPWANPEGARIDAEAVRLYARWHQGTLPEEAARIAFPSVAWLKRWLRADVSNAAGFALLLLALASVAVLAIRRPRLPEGGAWTLAIGFAGIAYVVALAPVPRFGWGYLATPAGVLAAALAGTWAGPALSRAAARSAALVAALLVALPALVLGRTTLTASERRVDAWLAREAPAARRVYWLLPPEIPLIRYDDKAGAALTLRGHLPRAGWFEPSRRPMYYPLEPRPGIRFRDPARGAAAGFERETRGVR